MANRWGNSGNSGWLYLFGSKITADGDCSHDIKICLLLGRKVLTNLDSILKSRDITLSTQARLVKAVVFPIVMYGCENGCFWTVVLEKTLESPLDCKEIQAVNSKGNQSWIFIRRTDTDSMEKNLMLGKIEGKTRRGWQRTRWLDGLTDSMDMSLSKLQ